MNGEWRQVLTVGYIATHGTIRLELEVFARWLDEIETSEGLCINSEETSLSIEKVLTNRQKSLEQGTIEMNFGLFLRWSMLRLIVVTSDWKGAKKCWKIWKWMQASWGEEGLRTMEININLTGLYCSPCFHFSWASSS